GFNGALHIAGRIAGVEHRLGYGAIEEPGIEMMQPVDGRDLSGDRPLARGGRPVDGDDHDKAPPSDRIKSRKPGKLVAMKLPSSILTGCSLARPSTSAAMAMR